MQFSIKLSKGKVCGLLALAIWGVVPGLAQLAGSRVVHSVPSGLRATPTALQAQDQAQTLDTGAHSNPEKLALLHWYLANTSTFFFGNCLARRSG